MNKSFRYVLYVLIGVAIYYGSGANKNPDVLKEFNGYAPALIIGVVVLLFIVRYMRKRTDNEQNDSD